MRRLMLILSLAVLLTIIVGGNVLNAQPTEVPEPVPEDKDLAHDENREACRHLLTNGVFSSPQAKGESDLGTFDNDQRERCDVVLPGDPTFDPSDSSEGAGPP